MLNKEQGMMNVEQGAQGMMNEEQVIRNVEVE
jgi:hypothetical protein